MRGRGWLLALLLLGAAPAAPAQPAKAPAPEAAAPLQDWPASIGPWRRDSVTDYAARSGNPGFGVGANYLPEDRQGGAATFYLYHRNRRDLVDGADSDGVAGEIAEAMREIELLGPQRRYRLAARQTMAPVTGPSGKPAMRCEAMLLEFEGDGLRRSILCVGVAGGRFVKLRLTRPAAAPGDPEKLAHAFAREMLAALDLRPK